MAAALPGGVARVGTPHLAYADLDRLETLNRVMRECMRMVTAVPGLARESVKDTGLLGYRVPAGSPRLGEPAGPAPPGRVLAGAGPLRSRPVRAVRRRRRNAWLPFGSGVHKCIGMHFATMQVKAAMHQLLLNFRWSVPAGYELPIDWSSLPRPKDGLPVRLDRT